MTSSLQSGYQLSRDPPREKISERRDHFAPALPKTAEPEARRGRAQCPRRSGEDTVRPGSATGGRSHLQLRGAGRR